MKNARDPPLRTHDPPLDRSLLSKIHDLALSWSCLHRPASRPAPHAARALARVPGGAALALRRPRGAAPGVRLDAGHYVGRREGRDGRRSGDRSEFQAVPAPSELRFEGGTGAALEGPNTFRGGTTGALGFFFCALDWEARLGRAACGVGRRSERQQLHPQSALQGTHMEPEKPRSWRKLVFQRSICRFHVKLPGCA